MTKRKQGRADESNRRSSQTDRRASRRFQVGWDVVIRRVGRNGMVYNETGNLHNLSSSGSYINLAGLAKVGDKLEVYIKLPTKRKHWIKYSCEIIRLQKNDGVGINFDKMRPEFVKSRLKRSKGHAFGCKS